MFASLLGSVNLFLALFNLVPLPPLDGGHIVGALWEGLRRSFATLTRRPDPGPVDTAKMVPVAYAVGGFLLLCGIALIVADIVSPGEDLLKETVMTVNLGMPAAPAPVLAPRKPTRRINVGKVAVGGDAPISVQSMTTTKTTDINGTLQQIAELTASGCDIVRVAVPSQDDADVLHIIAKKSQIPVIADIHFQPKYVFAAIDAGCAAVRVNPGNIKQFDDKVGEIAKAAADAGCQPAHRRQRRLARQAAARQVRRPDPRGAGRVGAVGGVPVRGARLPRLQDLGQAQRPDRHGERLPATRRPVRLPAAPRRHRGRARRSRARSRAPPRSASCSPRASATPSASRCRPRRWRRSRSARRSWRRSTCASARWRSSPAPAAAARRWTSGGWPTTSPTGWKG